MISNISLSLYIIINRIYKFLTRNSARMLATVGSLSKKLRQKRQEKMKNHFVKYMAITSIRPLILTICTYWLKIFNNKVKFTIKV
jgi:hypothetical protein